MNIPVWFFNALLAKHGLNRNPYHHTRKGVKSRSLPRHHSKKTARNRMRNKMARQSRRINRRRAA